MRPSLTVRGTRPLALVACAMTLGASACARRPRVAPPATPVPGESPREAGRRAATLPDFSALYERMGLAAARGDLPFVASVAQFATATPDSTLVLVALSLANRSLTFGRDGNSYRAAYEVRLEARHGTARRAGDVRRRIASDETVRVATLRETARGDESVLFYQRLALAPGAYTLSVGVRDASSARSASVEVPLVVARFDPGGLSTPLPLYGGAGRARLDSAPDVAARPRRTATFGEDATVPLYLESVDRTAGVAGAPAAAPVPVRLVARGDGGVELWRGAAELPPARDGLAASTVAVPVAPLGIGIVSLDVVRDASNGVPNDSVRTTLLVGLGDELPVATFDDVLGYLRYYAAPERLRALRDTPPVRRAAAWSEFARAHADLRDYFARVRTANTRFGEDARLGWLTDRGTAYVVLGEPDQIAEPAGQDPNMKGRTQRWLYGSAGVELTFTDRGRFGQWELTSQSAAQLQELLRRRLVP